VTQAALGLGAMPLGGGRDAPDAPARMQTTLSFGCMLSAPSLMLSAGLPVRSNANEYEHTDFGTNYTDFGTALSLCQTKPPCGLTL
jgi:hypothetical protein